MTSHKNDAKTAVSHTRLLEIIRAVQPGTAVTFTVTVNDVGDHNILLPPCRIASKVEDTGAT